MKKINLGLFKEYEESNILMLMGGKSYYWSATEANGVEVDDNQITSYSSTAEAHADGCDATRCVDARYDCQTGTYY